MPEDRMQPKRQAAGYPRGHRYGDFPHLFWDAEPAAPLDVTSPVTLARLLTRADARTVGDLVPVDIIREQLERLPIAEPTRRFWRCVLKQYDRFPSGARVREA